jgi:YidC/Oxa1 family membrane protein insertase
LAGVLAVVLVAGLAVVSQPAVAGAIPLQGLRHQVLVNLTGGLPGRWESCPAVCVAGAQPETLLGPTESHSRLAWEIPGDQAATRRLENLEYVAEWRRAGAGGLVLFLTSVEPFGGVRLVHRYQLDRAGRTLAAALQVPPGARLVLTGGESLAGDPLAGLGAFYTYRRAVRVNAGGQADLAEEAGAASTLPPGEWVGVRGRFWAVLVRAAAPVRVSARPEMPAALALAREGDGGGGLDLTFHAGPVTPPELATTASELGRMLYASLWNWLRALATGLRAILDFWQGLSGSWGLAIVLLSLSVKVLMWPLTWVAERWQAEVNRQQSLLAPELAAIKRDFRGEEAHNRTLEAYRRHGISPFYTLKSLAGFLVQIPVFIAAFDMLGENFGLRGASFLWIPDLSMPDRVAALPVVVPFFGGHLNLLPFLMTLFTVAAARLQEDPSLAPALRAGQRLRLYAIGGLFFVLLYTFPAGMVLYWTTNNLLHLGKILAGGVIARLRQPAARSA